MIEILKILIPSSLVLATAYLLIDKLLNNENERRAFELKKDSLKQLTPVRLRAYERLILVLERTVPGNLLLQVSSTNKNCMQLHGELLNTIRSEFSHNVSQQIYVSDDAWSAVKAAQENLIKLLNMCASQCQSDEDSAKLVEYFINAYASLDETSTDIAIAILKKEVRTFF
ncbi:MAG: hypothetical protein LBH80_02135 [Prevotellaceae bacterium]|jgi:hypothetical protein|nr:hypothetical protein [Prevotellaceae bacterium]